MKHLLRNVGVAGLVAGAVALAAPGQASGQGETEEPPPVEEEIPEPVQLEMSISPEEVEVGTSDPVTASSVDPCPATEPAFDTLLYDVYTWDEETQTGTAWDGGQIPLNEDGSWSLTTAVPDEADVYFVTALCFWSSLEELPVDAGLYYYDDWFTVTEPGEPEPTVPERPEEPQLPEAPTGPRPAPAVPGTPGFTG